MESKLEPQENERHARRVAIDLNEAQADALERYIRSVPLAKVSYSQAVLTLVIEALQARKLLPNASAPESKPTPTRTPPASSATSLD